MIAKSDFIVLALSTTFLIAGIIRWQHNTSVVPVLTIAASSQGFGVNVASGHNQGLDPKVTRLPARAVPEPTSSRAVGTVEPVAASSSRAQVAPGEPDIGASAQAATLAASEPDSPVSDPSPVLLGTYTVVSGDYLGWIAEEFETTVATLKELNDLDGNDIRIGQKLKYPKPN